MLGLVIKIIQLNEYALLQGKKSGDGHTYLNAYTAVEI